MEGKRPRGRPRIGMIDGLIEGSYVSMKMRAAAKDLPEGSDWGVPGTVC